MQENLSLALAERDIQALVAKFAYRDQEKWDQLADTFWPDATLDISWFSGTIGEFLAESRKLATSGKMLLKHLIGNPRVQISHDRALSETDLVIMLRVTIGDPAIPVDVTSWARFFDRHECRNGQWRISQRTAIYEKDRADPVAAGTAVRWTLAPQAMNGVPHEYRHLASAMMELGRKQMPPAIVNGSAEQMRLEQDAERWLAETVGTLRPSISV